MLLQVNDIHVHYGPIAAVRGISLEVDEADFVTIIGSNGAGKSTTLRTISGLNHPSSGTIVFDGQPIENGTIVIPLEAESGDAEWREI